MSSQSQLLTLAAIVALGMAWTRGSWPLAALALALFYVRNTPGLLMSRMPGKDADKITFARFKDPGAAAYAITYQNPLPFKSFVMVFDPAAIHYDWYQVQVTYTKYSNPSLKASTRYTDKGKPMTDNPGKHVLVIGGNNLDYSSKPYPVAGRSGNYIQSITVQFFVNRPVDAAKLAAFDNIRTQAEFRALGGLARPTSLLVKSGGGWNSSGVESWIA